MSLMTRPVLVLNASWEPINIICSARAIILLCKDVAIAKEEEDIVVHPRSGLKLPSVVMLKDYRRIPHRTVKGLISKNKKLIFQRDNYCCCYCGEGFTSYELTLDHVIPKSRGGTNDFSNLVSCCRACNKRKDDRTPEEANMPLLSKPRPVTIHTSRSILRTAGKHKEAWRKYLYYENDTPQIN